MTARPVIILLAAGVLVIALAVWLSSKGNSERATSAGVPVLSGLDKTTLNSISEVRLTKGDGAKTTLKKGATDWMVAERDYAADSGKVRKLLLDLAALNVVEEKTRASENYPALGVEDTTSSKATGTRVDAVTPARTFSLIVGKSSGAKSGYVRLPGSPQSLLAAPLITLDADPRRWLDNKLIDIPQDRIKEIAVKPADGPGYTATRASKDQSDFTVAEVPKGRELSNPAAADPIAGSLASLSLDDVRRAPADPPAGAPPHLRWTGDRCGGTQGGDQHVHRANPTLDCEGDAGRSADPGVTTQRLGVRGAELQVRWHVPALGRPVEEAPRARRQRWQGGREGEGRCEVQQESTDAACGGNVAGTPELSIPRHRLTNARAPVTATTPWPATRSAARRAAPG
jgi:hypothetical protein